MLLHVQIKKERMEEKLRLARLSQRLHFQDEGRGRLSHLYKKILTALHRQRKVGHFTAGTYIPSVDAKGISSVGVGSRFRLSLCVRLTSLAI